MKNDKASLFGVIAILLAVLYLTALGLLILTSAGAGETFVGNKSVTDKQQAIAQTQSSTNVASLVTATNANIETKPVSTTPKVANASPTKAKVGNPYGIVKKQSQWLVIAVVVLIVMSFIDLKFLKSISVPLAAVSIIMLCLVFFFEEKNGSYRWIQLGFFNIQPSDIAKFSFIILLSSYLYNNQRRITSLLHGLIKPLGIIALFCIPIILEPDYGTCAVVATIGFALIFLAGVKIFYILTPAVLGLALFSVLVYFNPVRLNRVLSFMDIESTKTEGSYQLYQGILAFGSGKITGVGIGQGRQQLSFLPEAHTDFVFAIIGEELGMICTMSVAFAFMIILLVGVCSLRKAPNLYEFSVALGALLMIVVQAISNMCVVTGLMPTKGISLPFISYGGSNLVMMFAFTGILVNCIRTWNSHKEIKIGKK